MSVFVRCRSYVHVMMRWRRMQRMLVRMVALVGLMGRLLLMVQPQQTSTRTSGSGACSSPDSSTGGNRRVLLG